MNDYLNHDGTALAALIRQGQASPLELVDAALARIDRLNPQVNAVIHRLDDTARTAARGPLPEGPFRGVPLLFKDLISPVAGAPFHCGSRFLKGYIAPADSELVSRYRRAGFIPVGKTNTPEFGLTPFTEPALYGPTLNPWDLTRTTGGSSGGSAAAVACGMVPVATGGDGGGSIRIPASCCGLFGMKPTKGRVPTGPDIGEIWHGAVVEHVLTRSVRDSAAILDATHGPDLGAPYFAPPPVGPFLTEVSRAPGRLRIAFTDRPWLGQHVHPDCSAALQDTVRLLEGLGHSVEEASPVFEGPAFALAFMTMLCGELRGDIEDAEVTLGRVARPGDFEPATWALSLLGGAISGAELSRALRHLQRVTRQVAPFFEKYDVLVTPTLGCPPVVTGALQPKAAEQMILRVLGGLRSGRLIKLVGILERAAGEVFEFMPWTPVINATGQPAMSLPLYWNGEGLPIGTHCIGRFGDEALLYRLAGQLERARPWFHRLAPLATG